MSQYQPRITVVGSMNMDTFMLVKGLPQIGETIAAKGVKKAFGGKVSQMSYARFNRDYDPG